MILFPRRHFPELGYIFWCHHVGWCAARQIPEMLLNKHPTIHRTVLHEKNHSFPSFKSAEDQKPWAIKTVAWFTKLTLIAPAAESCFACQKPNITSFFLFMFSVKYLSSFPSQAVGYWEQAWWRPYIRKMKEKSMFPIFKIWFLLEVRSIFYHE